jgi:hypothetical protein
MFIVLARFYVCVLAIYSPRSGVSDRSETRRSRRRKTTMARQHKTSRHELTPIERAYLVGRCDAGESFGHISSETGVPKTTVIDTVKNASERGTTTSLPRGGPCKTDIRDERILRREARKGPQARRIPLAQLQHNIQPPLSRSTIK